jgi:hypothetical protein
VAATVYSMRCAELKKRYTANSKLKEPSFTTQYNALWALSNLGCLSRKNCIWLGKRVIEMIERFTERDQREMLDRLQDRRARAWARWQKRIQEKQAAQEVKKGCRPPKQAAPAPEALVPTLDPWEE